MLVLVRSRIQSLRGEDGATQGNPRHPTATAFRKRPTRGRGHPDSPPKLSPVGASVRLGGAGWFRKTIGTPGCGRPTTRPPETSTRAILTLSSGALGVSIAFVNSVAPDDPKVTVLLALSWIAFALSLLIILTAYLTGMRSLRRDMRVGPGAPPDEREGGWLREAHATTEHRIGRRPVGRRRLAHHLRLVQHLGGRP